MVEEWRVSCDLIANLLGVRCIAGSVPGGDISPDVFQSADAAGMQFLFTSDPFLIPKQKGACWVLGRVCPRARTPLASVQRLAEFQGWTREQLRWRAKAALKIGFSPLYRVYARHVLQ